MAKKVKTKFDSGLLRFYNKIKKLVELQEELKVVASVEETVEQPKEEVKVEEKVEAVAEQSAP